MTQKIADKVGELRVAPSNLLGGGAASRRVTEKFSRSLAVIRTIAIVLAVSASGCGKQSTNNESDANKTTSPPAETLPTLAEPIPEGHGVAYAITVDLEGKALAGMIPIATLKPNAFDEPLASGPPTGPDGKGYVFLPKVERVYVRAWDPTLKHFAGNYLEAFPQEGEATELMRITMPKSATAVAILVDANGRPEPNLPVRIMLHHPKEGPWWPAETITTPEGIALFENLPPGEYLIEVVTPDGRNTQLPNAALPPGTNANLGKIILP